MKANEAAALVRRVKAVGSVVLGGVMALAGLGLALRALPPANLALGLGFGGPGLWLLVQGVRQLLAASAFEQLFFASLGPVPLGGVAEVQLVLTPKRPLQLTARSTLTLVCTERAEYSAGTRSRTYTNTVFSEVLPLDLPQLLSHHFERRLTVPIPTTIPPTWRGQSNSFTTKLVLHVDIDRWPDLELETPIEVLPEVAHGR